MPRRRVAAVVAWVLGGAVYLIAAIAWGGYDGFPSVILLPCCAAVVSAAFVAATLAVGTAVRPTPLGRVWRSGPVWGAIAASVSLAVLLFGSSVGLTGEYTDPDTGQRFEALHPAAALGGYFLLLFAIAHWPLDVAASNTTTRIEAGRPQ